MELHNSSKTHTALQALCTQLDRARTQTWAPTHTQTTHTPPCSPHLPRAPPALPPLTCILGDAKEVVGRPSGLGPIQDIVNTDVREIHSAVPIWRQDNSSLH